ncbi:PQQ-dependent dehydrogenase, methanol/ethanol family [Methylacidimicrobium sp. AP8]|uniref:PQQ-dependent dehydrogenase, methanol/ethanol family n=1 Tax=Methylacidimicrobium sp. AP8 TaxID=2730359 RepID=UPI0019248BE4|nr:PQQ-dependent dehydrogenase, methanol/ethanol family [Methylacidimicrobium sp. AP8]
MGVERRTTERKGNHGRGLRTIWVYPVIVLLATPSRSRANEELVRLGADPGQWPMAGKNYAATRYSELDQINTRTVERLHVAWSFCTGALRGHEGGPLVVGSTMYVHSPFPNTVYALDLARKPYAILWKYTPAQKPGAITEACYDTVNRGVAYGMGKIFLGTLDGQLIALDAHTGDEIWKVKQGEIGRGETITGAPIVIKDMVLVGISGGEFGVRGRVNAYDINTGKARWVAYSQGPDDDILLERDFNKECPRHGGPGEGTRSWPGEQWKLGGGTTWGWFSYDPGLDLFYYGSGNPGSWNPDERKGGDNKWACTLWGRRPATGMARWAYQMTPWDSWGYDGTSELVLVDLRIGEGVRRCAVHFDKNGFAYTLDRATGEVLSAAPFVYVNWAKGINRGDDRPIEVPEKRAKAGIDIKGVCPSAMGGKNQQPAAYAPQTHLFYLGTNNLCMDIEATEARYVLGLPYIGANLTIYSGHEGRDKYYGEFIAWDPVKGRRAWELQERFPVCSGALATAGGLVFYGTLDGWFKAVDARTGVLLWQQKLGSGIVGSPIAFLGPDNKEYVAVYSGVGGWFGLPAALDLPRGDRQGAMGASGAAYDSGLPGSTTPGGELVVFGLE